MTGHHEHHAHRASGAGGAPDDDPTAVRFTDKRRIDPTTGTVRQPPAAAQPASLASAAPVLTALPGERLLQLDSPQAIGLFGRSQRDSIAGTSLQLSFGGARPHDVAVLLSALDAQPVAQSRRLLLTLGSHTVGTQPGSIPARPKQWQRHPAGNDSWTLEPDPTEPGLPSGSRYATGPAWLTGEALRLTFAARHAAYTIYPLDGAGRRLAALPAAQVQSAAGRLTLVLPQQPATASPWYEIVASDGAPTRP